MSSTGVVN